MKENVTNFLSKNSKLFFFVKNNAKRVSQIYEENVLGISELYKRLPGSNPVFLGLKDNVSLTTTRGKASVLYNLSSEVV